MKYPPSTARLSSGGFTLVELAIVLVIIGLLVGGILVGRNMIESASIKAQINQITKFNTAAGTFKDKYRAIPGDMANATQFGLGTNGNGDGKLPSVGSSFAQNLGENYNFWYHLHSAGLIEFQGVQSLGPGLYTQPMFLQSNPQGKLNNTFLTPTSFTANPALNWGQGVNGYFLSSSLAAYGAQYWSTGLTPNQSRLIDLALDDGMPFSGKINIGPADLTVSYCSSSACTYMDASCFTGTLTYNSSLNGTVCNLAFLNQY